MSIVRNTIMAAGVVLLSAGAASANPAVAQNELNMRTGPGPQYPVVVSMPRGANAQVWNCDGAWCRVSWNGHSGFSSQRYLDITRYAPTEAAVAAPAVTYTAPGYADYAYAPEYRTYTYAPLPNPLDFPLLPWNW